MATISDTERGLVDIAFPKRPAVRAGVLPAGFTRCILMLGWRAGALTGILSLLALFAGQALPATGRLLFVSMSYRDRVGQLYMLDVDRGFTHHMTTLVTANVVQPLFSPDRTRLAFVLQRFENSRIYTIDADGRNLTNLSKGWNLDSHPTWSPDAERLAFLSSGRAQVTTLFVMKADGTDVRQLSDLRVQQQYPVWSPDGRYLAFAAGYLLVVDSYSGEVVMHHNMLRGYGTMGWSPDGRYLGFTAYYDGHFTAFLLDEAGRVQRLTDNDIDVRAITWSPDGRRLAFVAFHEGANADIYVLDVEDCAAAPDLDAACEKNRLRLTTDRAFDWLPAWSPDSRWISYVSYWSQAARIYLVASDGSSEPRYIITQGTSDYRPVWVNQ